MSAVKHGPVSPSAYDTRPERTASAPAVAAWTEGAVLDVSPPGKPRYWAEMLPLVPRKNPMGAFVNKARQVKLLVEARSAP